MRSLALDSRDLAQEIRSFLEDLEAQRWPGAPSCGRRLIELRASLERLADHTWPDGPLDEVRRRLSDLTAALSGAAPEDLPGWLALRAAVAPKVDALARALQDAGAPLEPSFAERPQNLVRNAYHVANAVAVVLLVELVLPDSDRWRIGVAAAGFAAAWSMEASRRALPAVNDLLMTLFGPVAHPHEATEVNSATWYTTAVLLLACFFPLDAAVAGLIVLGLGDPAAAIVGRRFGRHRLANGRSLEGALAFIGAAFLGAFLVLSTFHPSGPTQLVTRSLVAAAAGAVSELLATRVDDNLAIPLAAAAAAASAPWLLG